MKDVMPVLMQKAAAEKAAESNGGVMPESIPDSIKKLEVLAAISVGAGSACALYTKGEDHVMIEHLIANTKMGGQFDAQKYLVDQIVAQGKEAGLPEIRLKTSTHPTLYSEPAEYGFEESEGGAPWNVMKI
mmetsp:Transcript_45362/g.71145  ORF Transcript_45362/g.71145 Transcript_45362/m.71145 type:complete len:131 (-) Transcript_45362:79-471(-)